MTSPITIEARSPGLAGLKARIVVTLPTFRRPEHLLATLRSLGDQTLAERFAVVVMENDAERREGLDAARPLFLSGALSGLVLVAHDRGNCSAYNAGWETALAEFPEMEHLLVIDDDEIASPHWAERLVETAGRLGADIVGGPQRAVFEGGTSRFSRHPVFTPHYETTGPVPILYSSGNVLIRRRVLEAMGAPFLDTAFNFIGGGDSDFYARAKTRGFSFAWCAEAPVFETTPARRTEISWIAARSLRNGAISAIIHRRGRGRLRSLLKSAGLVAAAPVKSVRLALATRSPVIGLYPLQVAFGRVLGEIGWVNEQYRRPEQN